MAALSVGKKAPDFTLPADDGTDFRLADQRGHPVVLFFYATAGTQSCTAESLEYNALMPRFAELGAVVVGVSPDPVLAQCKFRDKYKLGFRQVSDPALKVIGKYGAWGPKELFGRAYDGLIRITVLIGADGKVAGLWRVTRIAGHAQAVLDAAAALPR